jgi:hypothetical protein
VITFLNNVDQLILLMVKYDVLFEVRTGILNTELFGRTSALSVKSR